MASNKIAITDLEFDAIKSNLKNVFHKSVLKIFSIYDCFKIIMKKNVLCRFRINPSLFLGRFRGDMGELT